MSELKIKILSIGTAHTLSQIASDMGDYEKLQEIWEEVKSNPNIMGDVDDYHNYAVVMSREDDYVTAFQIVERGLNQFPYNTDLLADAIYYGSNCQQYDKSQDYALQLLNRPYSAWTWRAFKFLIDFYKNQWDWEENIDKIKKGLSLALETAEKYQQYIPSDERSQLSEYDVLIILAKVALDENDMGEYQRITERAQKLLKDTIEKGEYATVQCCLRYADLLFQQQKYSDVISVCNKALQFGQETSTARLGYFMYLSAQSREVLLYQSGNFDNENEIKKIYSEYTAAFADTNESYQRNIKKRVRILSARTGVPYSDVLARYIDARD